ncbi:VOC family protein [Opitutus sp. ER46]|uniref:VOC family protein n=1 Tax=Opitutus sp. ER46 TaxID=2161864 RepID=UPI000D310B1D|nr:VOC family protein [Opitutus sp. ER46]PTY01081.1 glyoxalase [Opitutus sp. ER46]
MISIKEFAFTGYPVTDMTRARAFYEGLLGLKPASVFEHDGRHWIEYEAAGGTLAITNMAEQWKPSSQGPSIALEVVDFGDAVAQLKAAQVRFTLEPVSTGVCSMAVVLDPDGNCVTVHKRNAP